MDKLEKEISDVDIDIKENRRNRIEGVLESFAFALLDFRGIASDEYREALRNALNKLEMI